MQGQHCGFVSVGACLSAHACRAWHGVLVRDVDLAVLSGRMATHAYVGVAAALTPYQHYQRFKHVDVSC